MTEPVAPWIADPFSTRFLGRGVYRLTKPERLEESLRGFPRDIQGQVLIEAKVPTAAVAVLARLTAAGFTVVDTNVQLDVPAARLAAEPPPSTLWRVRPAEAADREAAGELSARNMTTSRFHLDPFIESDRASELKRVWVTNFFDGIRGDRLLLAETEGRPAGFLLTLERGDLGIIDLIAVDPILRGSGVVAGLIHEWVRRAPQLGRLLVGTQLSNVRSLRAYGRMGFRVCDATYVLHLHCDAQALRERWA